MKFQNNVVFNRIENSTVLFLLLIVLSLLLYSFTMNELLLWRSLAASLALSISLFIFYPIIRGIKAGDIIMVSVWKEIETPLMSDTYLDSTPTTALESGRVNQNIEVLLRDGSRGVVKILKYGFFSYPEGKLIELENPTKDKYFV
ncbi:MAG: hypothetical protein DRO92_03890 [Candidatus Altiarchaeales archaeon]|nr:MAG: hypothetical protein DRO92_03890 [Candidatus Altiarchaeales archaeon]